MLRSKLCRRPTSKQSIIEEHKVDSRDVCWGHPIRDANGIRVPVMFPWQTEQQTLLTNKDLLGAFEQLRVKGYSWARFMVTLDEDFLPSFSSMVQPSETQTEVVLNLNENETLADKCTQQLNNDVEIGNGEKENYSKAFLDEFEYDYNADGSDLGGFDPDGSDLDDAFRD
ncbi:hypothetical protein WN943_027645 [Citrus x changshan-huyou]